MNFLLLLWGALLSAVTGHIDDFTPASASIHELCSMCRSGRLPQCPANEEMLVKRSIGCDMHPEPSCLVLLYNTYGDASNRDETELMCQRRNKTVDNVRPAVSLASMLQGAAITQLGNKFERIMADETANELAASETKSEADAMNEDAEGPKAEALAEAEPETEAEAEPEAEAVAEAPAEPEAAAEPEAEEEAEAEPEPETQAEAEPDTPAEAEPEAPAESEAEPETPAEAEPEAPAEAEAEPETAAEAEPEAPAEPEPEPQPEPEPEPQPAPEAPSDGSDSKDYPSDQPNHTDETVTESNSKPIEGKVLHCFVCRSSEEEMCPTKPSKFVTCKANGDQKNGCFTLFKSDTNETSRGCLADLTEEGLKYCESEKKLCVRCYKKNCNNKKAPSAATMAGATVWLMAGAVVTLTMMTQRNHK